MTVHNQTSTRWSRIPAGTNLWLAALLLIQLLIILYVYYWPSPGSVNGGGPLLPNLQAEQVTGLRIEDQQGQSVALTRLDAGWVLDGTDNYPANALKANEIIAKTLAATTNRLVTRTADSHSRLQVADSTFNRRITLTTSTGDYVVYLGTTAGAGATHIRSADNNMVYLTNQIATWEVEPFSSAWIDTSYLTVPVDDIVQLSLHNPHGEIELLRDEDGQWQMPDLAPDQMLDSAQVNSLVNRVASISLLRVLGQSPAPEYELDDPSVSVRITRSAPAPESGTDPEPNLESISLFVGAPVGEDDGYVAKSSTSGYYVVISSFLADQLRQQTQDDLIALPTSEDDPAEEAIFD